MISSNNQNIDVDELELATISTRLKSFIIDDILITVIAIFILWDKIAIANGDFMIIIAVINEAAWQIIALKFLYHAFFIWYYGATVGKIIAKIKVINYDDYGRISFLNSVIRSASRILSEMFFYVGFIVAYLNDARQTFHDKTGRTLVVNV